MLKKMPTMTTVASGRCTSEPALVESAIGRKPRPATAAVVRTARIELVEPFLTAASSERPSSIA